MIHMHDDVSLQAQKNIDFILYPLLLQVVSTLGLIVKGCYTNSVCCMHWSVTVQAPVAIMKTCHYTFYHDMNPYKTTLTAMIHPSREVNSQYPITL